MTRWAWVIAVLYLLILVSITSPVLVLIADPGGGIREPSGMYQWWPYWVWVGVMFLCQAVLLLLPARAATCRHRPPRPLIVPVLVTGLMAGVLVIASLETLLVMGGSFSFGLVLFSFAPALVVAVLIWSIWAIFFYTVSISSGSESSLAWQNWTLLTGSVLELLIAVPTHVAARKRTGCFAVKTNFVGLTLGISVMLFAFGPAVYFLFLARWRRLQPWRRRSSEDQEENPYWRHSSLDPTDPGPSIPGDGQFFADAED